jgi:four helix bundle protein
MAGVRSLGELRAWQTSLKFKRAIYALIDSGALGNDFTLADQLRDASRSAVSQIAEGFGRFNPGDNARFVNMARASLIECRNHLIDAVDRRLISEETRGAQDALLQEALREIGGWLDYLQSPQAEENAKRAKARRIERRGQRTTNKGPVTSRAEREPSDG